MSSVYVMKAVMGSGRVGAGGGCLLTFCVCIPGTWDASTYVHSYPLEDPPMPSMSKKVSTSMLPNALIPGGSRENPAPGLTTHSF